MGTTEQTYAQALNEALALALARDPKVVLLGEDIGAYGGVFGVTRGLQARFGPERVRDTPISETAFLGCAAGLAMCGYRPVVELMFVDFALVAMDQIVNQIAKLRSLSGGQVRLPLVIRTQEGSAKGTGAQHAQCLEAFFCHVPGLQVVVPSGAADAKGLLTAAIRSDDPVIVLEHKSLYATREAVPTGEYLLPFGQAAVRRPGRDLTVVALSALVPIALGVAEQLATRYGIEAEVIDPRTLAPLDVDTIVASVKKTNRLLVAHEAWGPLGIGAEIAFRVQREAFDYLDAPVERVAAAHVTKPFAATLEAAALPGADGVIQAALALCGKGARQRLS